MVGWLVSACPHLEALELSDCNLNKSDANLDHSVAEHLKGLSLEAKANGWCPWTGPWTGPIGSASSMPFQASPA